jgi:hypothetical protein
MYTDGKSDAWGIQSRFVSDTVVRDVRFGDAGNIIDGGAGDDHLLAGTGNLLVNLGGGDCRNSQCHVDKGKRRTAANKFNWRCAA